MVVRIESVKIGASGIAALTATGGLSFCAPRSAFEKNGFSLDGIADELKSGENGMDLELDEPSLEKLSEIDEFWRAEKKALELCSRAEQNSSSLCIKLLRRGFSSSCVKAAIKELVAEGIVSDERYAVAWVSANARKKSMGPRRVAAQLRAKLGRNPCGNFLGSADMDALLRKAVSEVDFGEIFQTAAKKAFADLVKGRKSSKKLPRDRSGNGKESLRLEFIRALRSQGFSARDISPAFEALYHDWAHNDLGK